MVTKKNYLVELLDTKSGRITHGGEFTGRFPLEAERKLAKTLPKSINLMEMRDAKYGRYVFLASKSK